MRRPLVRYRNIIMDSARWDGFRFRDGDIVISTPPKCGTTWTQMMCALLIFQTSEFPQPLDVMSPWLDQLTRERDAVFAAFEAQTHRRFIKTHTPLDGLPFDERATYIFVGRDPRDVVMSWDNHMDNLDIAAFLALREKAVGLDDVAELLPDGPPIRLESERERVWEWIESDEPLRGLASMFDHLRTFWDARDHSNVVLLHFGDLKADLQGQMRTLAQRLAIDVPEDRWPGLVRAATFDEMRSRATAVAPNATNSIWHDNTRFFNKGTNGQWRRLFAEDDLQRYRARVRQLADDDLSCWIHQEAID